MSDKQGSTSQVRGKHTPGPWAADEFGYINADGQQIADVHVYDSKDCMDCGQCEGHSARNEPKLPYLANARLMAAAPEMLRLIQRLTSPHMAEMEYRMEAFIDAAELINQLNSDD